MTKRLIVSESQEEDEEDDDLGARTAREEAVQSEAPRAVDRD